MNSKCIFLIAGFLMISVGSCLDDLTPIRGNGIITTEKRRTGPFIKLENSTSIDIVYKKADTTSVTISADENLLEYIITETYNNTLEIKTSDRKTYLDFTGRPLVTITSPYLEQAFFSGSGDFLADEMSGNEVKISLSGSGDISTDYISCTGLSITISGSGTINIKDCQSNTSDISLSGSGNVQIKGQVEDCNFKISGSGAIFAENYIAGSASVNISGSANVFTYVENDLTAVISGSGNIYLKGNPTINQTVSGSGRIIKYK
jgi:hypothetical protein